MGMFSNSGNVVVHEPDKQLAPLPGVDQLLKDHACCCAMQGHQRAIRCPEAIRLFQT